MSIDKLKEYLESVDSSCSEVKIGIEITQKPCTDTPPSPPSGEAGTSGTSGISGTSGANGRDGIAGSSGTSATSGTSGTIFITSTSGGSGSSGSSGSSGITPIATSGTSGRDGRDATGGGGGSSIFDIGWINVADYGAIGGADSTLAFKNAIQAAINSGYHKIWIPASSDSYIIKETITFPGNFRAWVVKGAGNADGGAIEKRTKILWQGKKGACFNFVATRLSYISDFEIEGENDRPYDVVENYRSKQDVWNPQYWTKDGYSLDRNTAHSGISFDQNQTNSPWAAQTQIERVKITRCSVAFNISSTEGSQQGDTIWFKDTKVENCIYAYSIGQDQCRAVTIENPWVNNCYTAFTNNKFGDGNGSAFNIFGGQITTCFKIFECTNAYRGQMSVNGMFAEACGIIGAINGLGSNTNGAVFTGCEIGLDDNAWETGQTDKWTTPFAVMSVGGNIVFTGCNIHSKKKTIGFSGNTYQFIGTTFTDTYPIFPNDWPTVSITGRPMFAWDKQITDQAEVSGGVKKYVRYGISSVRFRNNAAPYTNVVNASVYIPYWGAGVWQPLPDTTEKQFEWSIPSNDTKYYKVGDYIDCQASTGSISGMGTDFGQAMIPGLEVVEVKTSSLVLKKISPEMRVESWYRAGSVYTEPYLFITGIPVKAKTYGSTVDCENGNMLKEGDYVYSDENVVRVISVSGTVVTFNGNVSTGELKTVV